MEDCDIWRKKGGRIETEKEHERRENATEQT
jgi:hypothetical protein